MYGGEVMVIFLPYSGTFAIAFNAKDLFEIKIPPSLFLVMINFLI
jgi:hypothetical protein